MLLKVPILGNRIRLYDKYKKISLRCGPWIPGHYYSPIPDLNEIKGRLDEIFSDFDIKEINLNEQKQIKLLNSLKYYYSGFPYFTGIVNNNLRYNEAGAFYRHSDAIFLYSIMRHFKPQRIIEIGSGHSSALMLDINEIYFQFEIDLTFIDPNPQDRLYKILRGEDKRRKTIKVKPNKVQVENIKIFKRLKENDILFIDSSHVSKVGSDLNFIVFKILPELRNGVLIHFHDIFYPFELPMNWILDNKWYWNENYLVRAFLMNNVHYEILLFNSFLHKKYESWFLEYMPECLIGSENAGSIWIKKVQEA